MKRRLLNLLTALSLALCLAVVALWLRSYWRYDLLGVEGGRAEVFVGSYHGHLAWAGRRARKYPDDDRRRSVLPNVEYQGGEIDSDVTAVLTLLRQNATWRVAGFSYTFQPVVGPPLRVLVTPSWSVALALAALPGARLWRRGARRRRARRGLCPRCGYDLRATPGPCPECGTAASVSTGG